MENSKGNALYLRNSASLRLDPGANNQRTNVRYEVSPLPQEVAESNNPGLEENMNYSSSGLPNALSEVASSSLSDTIRLPIQEHNSTANMSTVLQASSTSPHITAPIVPEYEIVVDNEIIFAREAVMKFRMTEQARGNCVTPRDISLFLIRFSIAFENEMKKNLKKCRFCANNGHSLQMINHKLTDESGNVSCPVLYRYVCEICKATGPRAHTWKYCPMNIYTNGDPVSMGMKPGPSRWRINN